MDFRLTIQFICILWQYIHLHLGCNLDVLEYDLRPKNLTLSIRYKEALLTWDYNGCRGISSNIFYHFYLEGEELVFVTNENPCKGKTVLHLPDYSSSEVCVSVVPVFNEDECQSASELKCANPGSIDINIECVVYNISSMTCTWTYSENLPYSTEHMLSLQQDTTTIICKQYENDVKMRTGNCTFHDLHIDCDKEVTILLSREGSEEYVIKDTFKPVDKEMLNSPTNITIRYTEASAILCWEPPHSRHRGSCFQYQIEKNKELISNVRNPHFMPNFENKCLIRIRARGDHICGLSTSWGQWSEEISCDAPKKQPAKPKLSLIIIILLGLSSFIILLTVIIAIYYKRLSKSFFPRIPQPKNYLEEAQGCKTNAVIKITDIIISTVSTSDAEEYISLQENNS